MQDLHERQPVGRKLKVSTSEWKAKGNGKNTTHMGSERYNRIQHSSVYYKRKIHIHNSPSILQPFILNPSWLCDHIIWSQSTIVYYWILIWVVLNFYTGGLKIEGPLQTMITTLNKCKPILKLKQALQGLKMYILLVCGLFEVVSQEYIHAVSSTSGLLNRW